MEIKLKNGHKLVVELCEYPGTEIEPEIVIAFQDENGIMVQDCVLVRAHKDQTAAEVLLWRDNCDEDYTDKIRIDEYNWED